MKPDFESQPPSHSVESHSLNVAPALGFASTQPLFPNETTPQTTAFDKVSGALGVITLNCNKLRLCNFTSNSVFKTLLDRFDYDDEPETAEEAKKDEIPPQPVL